MISPASLAPSDILQLQKAIGNQAVIRLTRQAGLVNQPGPTGSSAVIQRKKIPNLKTLDEEIESAVDAGDATEKISENKQNIKKLRRVYVPEALGDEGLTKHFLNKLADNAWRQSWYDRVGTRIQEGSKQTSEDILFWADSIKQNEDHDNVAVYSVELFGGELHDKGLGPVKVWFTLADLQTLPSFMPVVIKPEDRSIEKAILGSDDSVATSLNKNLSMGRKIKTLNMDTDKKHGTIVEFVSSGLRSMVEKLLRKTLIDSEQAASVETIAFALLTGLWDLHKENVMRVGGAPVLIDSDVAGRPTELESGPSQQQGFSAEDTRQVSEQLKGNKGANPSTILDYAMKNPDAVIRMVKDYIGDFRGRIVPVFTSAWAMQLHLFLIYNQNKQQGDDPVIKGAELVSQGLEKELGPSKAFPGQYVMNELRSDFDKGVIPYFEYQPKTGLVFFHGQSIWQGKNLDSAMAVLNKRLKEGAKE